MSRRGILGGAAAVAAVSPALAQGITVTTIPSAAGHPDAVLIAACVVFCEAERVWQRQSNIAGGLSYDDPAYAAAEAEADRLAIPRDAALDAVMAAPCTTLEGTRALAAALATWDADLFNPLFGDTNDVLVMRIVRGLLALPGSAAA